MTKTKQYRLAVCLTGFTIAEIEYDGSPVMGQRWAFSNAADLLAGIAKIVGHEVKPESQPDTYTIRWHAGGCTETAPPIPDAEGWKSPPSDEDDGWRVWEGGDGPPPGVKPHMMVELRSRSGFRWETEIGDDGTPKFTNPRRWHHDKYEADIVAYRVVPPAKPIVADEWIPWDGKGEPALSKHERVMVRFKDGEERGPYDATSINWEFQMRERHIIAYKVLGAEL